MFSILEKKSNEYDLKIKELENLNCEINNQDKKIYILEISIFLSLYILLMIIPLGSIWLKALIIGFVLGVILYFYQNKIKNFIKNYICSVKLKRKANLLKIIYSKEQEIIQCQKNIQSML